MTEKKFIEVRTSTGSYLILNLGLEGSAKDAIRQAAQAWAGTIDGMSHMLENKISAISYAKALDTIPDSICVQYGFLPVRRPIPFEQISDSETACSMTSCAPDKNAIDDIIDRLVKDCTEQEYNAFQKALDIQYTPEPIDPAVRAIVIDRAITKRLDDGQALSQDVNQLLIGALRRRLAAN